MALTGGLGIGLDIYLSSRGVKKMNCLPFCWDATFNIISVAIRRFTRSYRT